MGQRIAVMNHGLLQQCDTPQNIYRHPANMFVAGFIGMPPMNFVKGATVKMENNHPVIDCGGFSVTMHTERAAQLAPYVGKEVIFGVRPEHLNDRSLVSGTPTNVVRAQVEVIEQMGATSNLYISLGGHPLVSVVDASTIAKESAPLDIVIDADHCHVFDKDTEQAIF